MEPTNPGEAPQEVTKLSQVIQLDEGKIQARLREVVRSTVEATLNAMLQKRIGCAAPNGTNAPRLARTHELDPINGSCTPKSARRR